MHDRLYRVGGHDKGGHETNLFRIYANVCFFLSRKCSSHGVHFTVLRFDSRLTLMLMQGPGLFFVIPCIDSYKCVDLRTVSFDVPPQEVSKYNCVDLRTATRREQVYTSNKIESYRDGLLLNGHHAKLKTKNHGVRLPTAFRILNLKFQCLERCN